MPAHVVCDDAIYRANIQTLAWLQGVRVVPENVGTQLPQVASHRTPVRYPGPCTEIAFNHLACSFCRSGVRRRRAVR